MGIFKFASGLALIGTATASASTAPSSGCHLVEGIGVACLKPQDAADAFQAYGFDRAALSKDYTMRYLDQFGCGAISDQAAEHHFQNAVSSKTARVATTNGWVALRFIIMDSNGARHAVWIADPYFAGVCLDPQPATSCSLGDGCNEYEHPERKH